MTRGSRSSRVSVCVLALFAVVMPLSGCDPGHPFVDVRVKVQARSEGSAALTAWVEPSSMSPLDTPPEELPEASPDDAGIVSSALVSDLDLGRVDGEPQNLDREFGAGAVGVEFVPTESKSLTIDLGELAAWLRSIGVRDDAEVYVSVCNAAGRGGATARFATIAWSESCGTWRGYLAEMPTDGWITLDPAHQSTRDRWLVAGSVLLVFALAVLVVLGLVALSPRVRRGRPAAMLVMVIVAVIDALMLAIYFASQGLDSWFSVGQNLGAPPWRALGGYSLVIALVGGIGALIRVAQLAADRRPRRSYPPVRH